jgi:hypothetical protein
MWGNSNWDGGEIVELALSLRQAQRDIAQLDSGGRCECCYVACRRPSILHFSRHASTSLQRAQRDIAQLNSGARCE